MKKEENVLDYLIDFNKYDVHNVETLKIYLSCINEQIKLCREMYDALVKRKKYIKNLIHKLEEGGA